MSVAGRRRTVTLWRPVGPAELALLRESDWRAWPPRLPDQPIFYPVLNEAYAIKIARDWNVPASGAGYVTRFEVDAEFARRYPVQRAGGRMIRELWVPAEELAEFNTHLVGRIQVTREFHNGTLAERVTEAAAGTGQAAEVRAMLSVAGPRTWISLDRTLRNSSRYYQYNREYDRRWQHIVQQREDQLAVLAMACSASGRERQAAVEAPAIAGDALLLPVLVIRSADWASQVREQARRTLAGALQAADGPGLTTATGVAIEIGQWMRGGHALEAVTHALHAAPAEALAAVRGSEHLGTRRLAYRVWLESGRAAQGEVVQAALYDRGQVIRSLCAAHLAGDAVRTRDPGPLGPLLNARTSQVRLEALTALVRLGHPEAGHAHLADRSAMMRATAQWAVRRSGHNPAALYRTALAGQPVANTRALVAGLGECGTAHDIDTLVPYLRHDKPRVRAEAVRALRRLGGALPQIATMLTDPAPVVVRAVTAMLRTQPGLVPTSRLWDLLAAQQPSHVRLAAYNQLTKTGTWTRIRTDLHLIATGDPELAARAHTDLANWLDKDAATTYTGPTAQQSHELHRLLDATEPALTADQVRRLRWILPAS